MGKVNLGLKKMKKIGQNFPCGPAMSGENGIVCMLEHVLLASLPDSKSILMPRTFSNKTLFCTTWHLLKHALNLCCSR